MMAHTIIGLGAVLAVWAVLNILLILGAEPQCLAAGYQKTVTGAFDLTPKCVKYTRQGTVIVPAEDLYETP